MTYEASVTGIDVIDGVEVDVTVRSEDEQKADKTLLDIQEQCGRIAAAFEREEPPRELSEFPDEFRPMWTVNWESTFEDDA